MFIDEGIKPTKDENFSQAIAAQRLSCTFIEAGYAYKDELKKGMWPQDETSRLIVTAIDDAINCVHNTLREGFLMNRKSVANLFQTRSDAIHDYNEWEDLYRQRINKDPGKEFLRAARDILNRLNRMGLNDPDEDNKTAKRHTWFDEETKIISKAYDVVGIDMLFCRGIIDQPVRERQVKRRCKGLSL